MLIVGVGNANTTVPAAWYVMLRSPGTGHNAHNSRVSVWSGALSGTVDIGAIQ